MMQKRVDVLEIIIQAQLDWFKFATFSPAKHIVCQSTLPARQRGPGESFRLLKYTVGKRKNDNILAIYCFTFAGSLTSDCAKVKAYISKKYWLKILTKGIKPFSGCGHL